MKEKRRKERGKKEESERKERGKKEERNRKEGEAASSRTGKEERKGGKGLSLVWGYILNHFELRIAKVSLGFAGVSPISPACTQKKGLDVDIMHKYRYSIAFRSGLSLHTAWVHFPDTSEHSLLKWFTRNSTHTSYKKISK